MDNTKNLKIIVAHPGKQHSFQTAMGLKRHGMLYKYATTVYFKEGSLTEKISSLLLKGKSLKKASMRKCTDLDDSDVIQFNEFLSLITLILSRNRILHRFYLKWNQMVASSFYNKVMRYAKQEAVDAVIVYDGYSNKHFEILKDTKILKIMDVSIANRAYIKQIFEKDIALTSDDSVKNEEPEYWNSKMMRMDRKGVNNTDYFIVASNFVKDSLVSCGVKQEKIIHIPYGANVDHFKPDPNLKSTNGPLQLIYVGQVSYRKGVHHLLEAISAFKVEEVQLRICGQYDKKSSIMQKYGNVENVKFEGFITQDVLQTYYQSSDLFILASLGEGMAMVGLEAMACALPVFCTEYTGINDLIDHKKNGYIMESYNTEAIVNAISWALNNRTLLPKMGKEARKIAEVYTWNYYQENLANAINNLMRDR